MGDGKKILFINRRGPYGTIYAQEALEVALVGAVFDQKISLAFIDDGVFLLRPGQSTVGLQMKQFTAAYRALGDFEIHRVYVERESLQVRGMKEENLMEIVTGPDGGTRNLVKVVSSVELMDVIHSQDVLLND
ncbi:MAG: Intracellular sulfur oxidation protein DsrF [Gammaproteobacteria bacterium]|nr:Intracellular sulfur oxidation protein DsrF [Gammaproteobacteria bacterium]